MDTHESIAALLDGERVSADDVLRALSTEEGRQYLVDILALRDLTAERAPSMLVLAATPHRHRMSWRAGWIAAAVVMLAAIGGYVTGHRATASRLEAPAPTATSAPAPTSVIRLKPGVDWTEAKGGA